MKKELIIYKKWEKANLLQASFVLLGFSTGRKKNRQIKPFFKNAFVILRKDDGILYWPRTNYEKAVKKIDELMKRKPKYQIEILKQVEKKTKEIKKATTKILKLSLNKKSDQELIKLLQQVYNLQIELADLLAVPNICILEYKEINVCKKDESKGSFAILVKDAEDVSERTCNFIVKEISRRTFYSVKQLNCALPNEIKDIFNKKGLKRYELDARHSLSLVQVTRNGILKITGGVEAKKFIKKNAK